MQEAIDLPREHKLAYLQNKGGARTTFGIVKVLIINMCHNLHIDNTLTETNINNIASSITGNAELRWWLTLADIDLLCRQIVEGCYGNFYGHFSEIEFNDCLARYCRERAELHRIANDKAVTGEPAVLEEVGYKVDAHGKLIVPKRRQGVGEKKPLRYLYNERGDIVGENPRYWAKVRQEKTPEEIRRINEGNALLERTLKIIDEHHGEVGYVEAYEMAIKERQQTQR